MHRWRKSSRSRSRSRRRSRSPKKSPKSYKSSRKQRSKSPTVSRIPSPVHSRSRRPIPPQSKLERDRISKAKISETSLFAELVKDRNMRELALKKLQAATEKANQDDIQIIDGSDEKDNSNSSTTTDKIDDKSSTAGTTPCTNVDLTVDITDIPVPALNTPVVNPTKVIFLLELSLLNLLIKMYGYIFFY